MKKKLILLSSLLIMVTIIGIIFKIKKPGSKDIVPVGYGFKSSAALSSAKGEIGNFALLDQFGDYHQLYLYSDAKAIVIISQGNDCPIIQKYATVINDLKKKYEKNQIVFLMINANKNDTRQAIQVEAKNYNYTLPILMDPSQLITESLGITRTSEVVILNPDGWKLTYRGAIDDRLGYGVDKQIAQNNFLDKKLASIVSGQPDTVVESTPAKGCLYSFEKPASLSYEHVVGNIIANKCLNCHNEKAGYLPYFSNYEKLRSWVAMSKETIINDRMPPSGVDQFYGPFRNNLALTPEEKRTIIKWIDAGAPKDGTLDPLANFQPKENKFKKKFANPVFSAGLSSPVDIPPGGTIEYIFNDLGGPTPQDMWVSGIKTISTNPRQLHHASLMVTSQPLSFYQDIIARKKAKLVDIEKNVDGDIPLVTLEAIRKYEFKNNRANYYRAQIWGAGRPQPFFFIKGTGMFVPKGSHLVLESHYMGSGKPENEQTTVEFYGHNKQPAEFKRIHLMTLVNSDIKIPPRVKDFVVKTKEAQIENDIYIISSLSHLHMRGKAVKLSAVPPKGEEKTIISIPNYYYGWQTGAGVSPVEPMFFKKGTIFKAECHYDNSKQNPNNPDPEKTVNFGQRVDRTEMCNIHLNFIDASNKVENLATK